MMMASELTKFCEFLKKYKSFLEISGPPTLFLSHKDSHIMIHDIEKGGLVTN
jgi:hypothetical protein